jgi:hypothetical protein
MNLHWAGLTICIMSILEKRAVDLHRIWVADHSIVDCL